MGLSAWPWPTPGNGVSTRERNNGVPVPSRRPDLGEITCPQAGRDPSIFTFDRLKVNADGMAATKTGFPWPTVAGRVRACELGSDGDLYVALEDQRSIIRVKAEQLQHASALAFLKEEGEGVANHASMDGRHWLVGHCGAGA